MTEIEWSEPGGEGPQWAARVESDGLAADLGVDSYDESVHVIYVDVRLPGELAWTLALAEEANATVDEAKRRAEELAPLALAKAQLLRSAEVGMR